MPKKIAVQKRLFHAIPEESPSFLKVCTLFDLQQEIPIIDLLADFAPPRQLILTKSVLAKFSEPGTTYEKLKAEFL